MKVKNLILILATATLVFSSCNGGKMTPIAYNQKLEMMILSFMSEDDLVDELRDESFTNDAAKKAIDSLVILFDKSNKELAAIKYPDKAEGLQNAVVAFLKYRSDKMLPAIKDVVSHERNSDEFINSWNKLFDLKDEGLKLQQNMLDEQAKFARESGYQIQKNN